MSNYSCLFCDDVNFQTNLPAKVVSKTGRSKHGYYLLKETKYCFAIVGLGALTPGYILILPKKHLSNIGELNGPELEDFNNLKAHITLHINKYYGDAVFFEHGSSRDCISSGACIDHAHLHALPSFGKNFAAEIPSFMKTNRIGPITNLSQFASSQKSYLYLETNNNVGLAFTTDQEIPGQFFRKIWAKLLQKGGEYDYVLFWGTENMEITYNNYIEYVKNTDSRGEVFTQERIDDNEVYSTIKSYKHNATEYIEKTNKLDFFPGLQEWLDKFIDILPGKMVLDVAFGSGRDTLYMTDHGLDVISIELVDEFIDFLKQKISIPICKMDMRQLGFTDNSFDGIWCCSSFLHLPRKDALLTLNDFARVLKKNGVLYLSLKNGSGDQWLTDGNISKDKRYFTYYSADEINRLLTSAGFEVSAGGEQISRRKTHTWLNILGRKL